MPRPVDARAPDPPPRHICPCGRPADGTGYCLRCQGLLAHRLWADVRMLWGSARYVGPWDRYAALVAEGGT